MEIGQVPAYKRWSNRYSHAFKMEVIEAFQSGQMSQRQVTIKYGKRYGKSIATHYCTAVYCSYEKTRLIL